MNLDVAPSWCFSSTTILGLPCSAIVENWNFTMNNMGLVVSRKNSLCKNKRLKKTLQHEFKACRFHRTTQDQYCKLMKYATSRCTYIINTQATDAAGGKNASVAVQKKRLSSPLLNVKTGPLASSCLAASLLLKTFPSLNFASSSRSCKFACMPSLSGGHPEQQFVQNYYLFFS